MNKVGYVYNFEYLFEIPRYAQNDTCHAHTTTVSAAAQLQCVKVVSTAAALL